MKPERRCRSASVMSDTLCGGLVGSIRLDVAIVDELLVFSIREVAALLFVVGVDDGFSVCSVVVGEAWSGVGCRGTISDALRTDAHGGNARRASLWDDWRNVVVAFTVRSVQRLRSCFHVVSKKTKRFSRQWRRRTTRSVGLTRAGHSDECWITDEQKKG